MERPRLRGHAPGGSPVHSLNNFSKGQLNRITEGIVFHVALGRDISGNDWGRIFASSVRGEHLSSPQDLADVVVDHGHAWSCKTVKRTGGIGKTGDVVRLISGRNSPRFSYKEKDWESDIQRTGRQVLAIRNERIDQCKKIRPDTREVVLIRSDDMRHYAIFEHDIVRFDPSQFRWELNGKDNLEGRDAKNNHKFTWQPHGAQLTHLVEMPKQRGIIILKETIPLMSQKQVLDAVGYKDDWRTLDGYAGCPETAVPDDEEYQWRLKHAAATKPRSAAQIKTALRLDQLDFPLMALKA